MLNSITKLKLQRVRGCSLNYFSLAYELFILQLNPLSTLSANANAQKPYSENANQHSYAANYLKNAHGFPPERALTYSKYLNFDSIERPNSVIAFFKKHHFTNVQISRVVRRWPYVFNYVPEQTFVPKIEFLHSLGFSSPEIVKILTADPRLLSRSLETHLIPCVDFLRNSLHSVKDVIFAIMRFSGIFSEQWQDKLVANVGILKEAGVPESHIAALLKIDSRKLSVAPNNFRETVEQVKKLGFNPQKKMFIYAIFTMRALSRLAWKEKAKLYERWGLSENEVMDAFKKWPMIMTISQDKTTRVMDFLINEMACDVWVLMSRPIVLSMSFEKTIVPRCAIYRVLVSKGLIKKESCLVEMLKRPHRLFLGRYVMPFEKEAPELLKIYEGTVYSTEA